MLDSLNNEGKIRTLKMSETQHIRTKVLPGNRIEIPAAGVKVGTPVDVIVVVQDEEQRPLSAIDVISGLGGRRLFRSPTEADRHLREERGSWEA